MPFRNKAFVLSFLLLTGLFCSTALAQEPDVLAEAKDQLATGKYDAANDSLLKVLDANKENWDARVLLSRVKFETGKYADAETILREVIENSPNHPAAMARLAEVLMTVGKYADAGKLLDDAIKADEKNIRARLLQSQLHMLTGNYEQAEKEMDWFFEFYNAHGNDFTSDELTIIAQALWPYAIRKGDAPTQHKVAEELLDAAVKLDPKNVEAMTFWGYCFLERYDFPEAVVSFQGNKGVKGALQVNPKYVPAMVGVGFACLAKDNHDGARKAADQALQVNPNSVEALELQAMTCFAKDDSKKAMEICKKALEVNPCSMNALATLACCDSLDGPAFKDAEKKALETNPKCSTFYNSLADHCVNKYMMAEATKFYEKAIELDPSNWQAQVGMGMHLFRLGDEKRAKEYLDKAYENDKFHVWNRNTLTLIDSFETAFTMFKTEHLDVRIDNNDRDLMQGYLGDLLEQIYAKLSARYKYEVKGRMLFELYDKHSDFSVRTLGVPGLGALGVCFGNVFVSLSPETRKDMGPFNWGSVVAHEFAHVFTLNMSNFKVPRWFTEGCSVYAEKTCGSGWDRELELDIYNAYCSGNLLHIPQLKSIFDLLHIYELSSVIIEYMDKTRGFDKIIEMLKLWAEGKSDEDVFKTALGMTIEEFDKEFFDFLVNDWFKRFRVRPQINRKTVTAALLRDRIAKDPQDADALATLARMLLEDKKPQDAKEYALKAIAINDKNIDALNVMGNIDLEKRKFKEAAEWYEKSLAAGTDDFGTHFRLAKCYQKLEKTDLYERELLAAKKAFPRHVAAGDNPYFLLAALYKEKGREDERLRELAELDAVDHLDPKPKMELATLYQQRNATEKMVAVLEKVVFIDPKDVKLHVYLGEGLRALGRHEEALRETQLAILLLEKINKEGRCDKLIAERYCEIAETQLSLGNKSKALEALNQALIMYPSCEQQVNEIRERIGK